MVVCSPPTTVPPDSSCTCRVIVGVPVRARAHSAICSEPFSVVATAVGESVNPAVAGLCPELATCRLQRASCAVAERVSAVWPLAAVQPLVPVVKLELATEQVRSNPLSAPSRLENVLWYAGAAG